MNGRLFTFVGGDTGEWQVTGQRSVIGDAWPTPARIALRAGDGLAAPALPDHGQEQPLWRLRGVTSNDRYLTRPEKQSLAARQQGLGRPEASCAALIPIRKSAAWWALTQDERREIMEEQSQHFRIGLDYLPAIARRLHHCRDLGGDEPFDFLTWFEFAPEHGPAFDQLLARLRASPEWRWVEHEVEFRVRRG